MLRSLGKREAWDLLGERDRVWPAIGTTRKPLGNDRQTTAEALRAYGYMTMSWLPT